MTVPTSRDHASVVALVECALVEGTHDAVGAVFVSRQVGRSTRTQYVAADDLVDGDVVTPGPEDRVLVYEPSDAAFDSTTQLAVFHRDWAAARDADEEGE